MTDALTGSFHRPFDEQLAALELRMSNLVGTSTWQDLQKAQHERAFVVAGAMKADLLDDLAKAVLTAARDGTGLEAFRAQFRDIVQKHGWHGWTGEGTPKGEAWRTKVIYRTNMATSYAAGRMAQLQAANYKFWIYKHGNAIEPRLQHLAWDGLALPPEHPFWETHAPPNGWGCTCRIRGADSERGIKAAKGDPTKTLPDGWQDINPKTGAQVGIDKGWDYKVGASVAEDISAMVDKLPRWPAPIGAAAAAEVSQTVATELEQKFATFVDISLSTFVKNDYMIVGALHPDWISAAQAQGIQIASAEIAVTDRQVQHTFRGTPAVTVKSTKEGSGGQAKVDPLDVDWFKALPRHLLAPRAVLLDRRHPEPVFLLVFDVPGSQARLVIEVNTYVKKAGTELNSIVSGRLIKPGDLDSDLGGLNPKVTQIEGSPL